MVILCGKMQAFNTEGASPGVSYTDDPLWHAAVNKPRITRTTNAEAGEFMVITDWIDLPFPSVSPT